MTKFTIAYKYEDENNKDKYIQISKEEFESAELANNFIYNHLKDGSFVILKSNEQ